jgi:glycosyltransferase involved in cell wall biosynthesis
MYSVVIPTHNRAQTLRRAVHSALQQTRPPGEIIIVDDASEPPVDGAEWASGSVPVVLIRCAKAAGAQWARNLGIERAKYEFIAFLDDDDEWMSSKMEEQLDCLRRRPELVAVTCGRKWVRRGLESSESFDEAFADAYFWHEFLGSSSTLTFRADDRTRSLRLDVELRSCQDWDFVAQLRARGPVGMLPQPLCRVHVDANARITGNYSLRFRGLKRFLEKHHDRMPRGARQWIRARLHFLQIHIDRTLMGAARHLLAGVALALTSDLPLLRRLATTARMIAEAAFGFERMEALKIAIRRWLPQHS